VPKISILILLIELYIQSQNIGLEIGIILGENINFKSAEIKFILLISSLLSLIFGTLVGLAQNRIKRLLA
jgi:NADH-ubiquinone oxidoreductase chain 2